MPLEEGGAEGRSLARWGWEGEEWLR